MRADRNDPPYDLGMSPDAVDLIVDPCKGHAQAVAEIARVQREAAQQVSQLAAARRRFALAVHDDVAARRAARGEPVRGAQVEAAQLLGVRPAKLNQMVRLARNETQPQTRDEPREAAQS